MNRVQLDTMRTLLGFTQSATSHKHVAVSQLSRKLCIASSNATSRSKIKAHLLRSCNFITGSSSYKINKKFGQVNSMQLPTKMFKTSEELPVTHISTNCDKASQLYRPKNTIHPTTRTVYECLRMLNNNTQQGKVIMHIILLRHNNTTHFII